MPAVSATASGIRVNRCELDLPEPTSFDGCCSRMKNAPAECCRALERCGTVGYFQNARPATRQHDDNGHSTHRKRAFVFVRPRRRVASPMTAPLAGFGFGSLSLFQNGPHMREFPAACACVAVLFGGTCAVKRIQRIRENRSAAGRLNSGTSRSHSATSSSRSACRCGSPTVTSSSTSARRSSGASSTVSTSGANSCQLCGSHGFASSSGDRDGDGDAEWLMQTAPV